MFAIIDAWPQSDIIPCCCYNLVNLNHANCFTVYLAAPFLTASRLFLLAVTSIISIQAKLIGQFILPHNILH